MTAAPATMTAAPATMTAAPATMTAAPCRPQRWEIAAAMVLAPTGAAGGRTWYVARALQRVARVHGRVAGHQLAVVPGTRLHARTSDGALRDRTRAWTHGQARVSLHTTE